MPAKYFHFMFIPDAVRWQHCGISVRSCLHGVGFLLLVSTDSMRLKGIEDLHLPSLAIAADGSGVKAGPTNRSPFKASLHNSSIRAASNSSDILTLRHAGVHPAASQVNLKDHFSMRSVLTHSLMQLHHFASRLRGFRHDGAVHRSSSPDLLSDSLVLIGINVILVVVVLIHCLICMYYCGIRSSQFVPEESDEEIREDPKDIEQDDIEMLAIKLRRMVQKYPSKRASSFSKVKDRFIAVLPSQDYEARRRNNWPPSESFVRRPQRWEAGRLSWWENETLFLKHEKPKGYIKLASIVALTGGQDEQWEYKEVEVSFVDGVDVERLTLLLPSQTEAQAWAKTFSMLLDQARPSTSSYPWRANGMGESPSGKIRCHTFALSSSESNMTNEEL